MWKSHHPVYLCIHRRSTSHDTLNTNPETWRRTERDLLLYRQGPKHMNLYILPLTVSNSKKRCWSRSIPDKHVGNLNHSISKYLRAWFFNCAFICLNKVQLPKEMRQGNKAELICLCLLNLKRILNKLGREMRVSVIQRCNAEHCKDLLKITGGGAHACEKEEVSRTCQGTEGNSTPSCKAIGKRSCSDNYYVPLYIYHNVS